MAVRKIISDVIKISTHVAPLTRKNPVFKHEWPALNSNTFWIKRELYVPSWVTSSLKQTHKRHFFQFTPKVLSAQELVGMLKELDLEKNRALIYAAYPEELGTDFMEAFYRSGERTRNTEVLKTIPAVFMDFKRKVIGNIHGDEIIEVKNEHVALDLSSAKDIRPIFVRSMSFPFTKQTSLALPSIPAQLKEHSLLRAALYPYTQHGNEVLTPEKAQQLLDLIRSQPYLNEHEIQAIEYLFSKVMFNGLISQASRIQKGPHKESLDDIVPRFWRPEGFTLYDKDTDGCFDRTVKDVDIVIPNRYDVTGISEKAFQEMLTLTRNVDHLFITGIIDSSPDNLKKILSTTKATDIFIDRSVHTALRDSGWKKSKRQRFHIFNYQDDLTRKILSSPSIWDQGISHEEVIEHFFKGELIKWKKGPVTMFDIIRFAFGDPDTEQKNGPQ